MSERRIAGWLDAIGGPESDRSIKTSTRWQIVLATFSLVLLMPGAAAAAASQIYAVDVPAGGARECLLALSAQAALNISLEVETEHVDTRAVSGEMSAPAALREMLAGTGLTFAFVAPHDVEVRLARGEVRWYDIDAGPARENIHRLVTAVGWDASIDRNAIDGVHTAAVRGCLTAEGAARALFAGTPLTYQWNRDADLESDPQNRALLVRAHSPSRWSRLFRRTRLTVVIPQIESGAWQCYRLCARERDSEPPRTCVLYPEIR